MFLPRYDPVSNDPIDSYLVNFRSIYTFAYILFTFFILL